MAGSTSSPAHYQASSDEGATANESNNIADPEGGSARRQEYVNGTSDWLILNYRSWLADLVNVEVDDVDLQRIVMNYLVINMCEDSYSRFIEETGYTGPDISHTIASRRRIRDAILQGRAQDARALIDEVDPRILQKNVHILFNLLSYDLIDIIKAGDANRAVAYARDMLAPCVHKDSSLVEKLEEIMGLITFANMDGFDSSGLISKMHQPKDTAKLVDIALMQHFGQETHVTLEALAKEAAWLQAQLSDEEVWKHIRYRDIARAGIDFAKDTDKV
ncbi:C20orf11 homolog, putative [Babesia ovata]|uniref:C20orf11 homolog, putative n=1 Tax=Babesia ovata TaxID=189622 RepID=A0A2H6KGS6_9APIC|nr:C20orf11 homolog, putative [Babesia ovata]GBE62198.1 C20orf11 homolog, putative [Babesia ovata]